MNEKSRHPKDMDVPKIKEIEPSVTALTAETQGLISKQLRQVYSKMLAEPMPDKFAKLLDELSKPETTK